MVWLSYTKGILKVYDWQGIGCDFEIECKDTTFIWNKQTFCQKKFSTILQKCSKTKTQYAVNEHIALLRIGQKLSKKK